MNAALTDTAELTDTAAPINEETPDSTRSDVEQLGSEICALAGQIAAATARFLTLLSKFDEDRGWSGPGLHSCAHWLSWKCGMSLHTGREYVRVAKALRPLPEMRKAFEQGRLSYSKVRALTRVTTPSNEQQMVRFGCEAPAAQIDRLAAGLRKATDNESGKSKAPEHLQVRWHWDSDTGEFVIKGRLPAQDGARILAALAVAERERTRTAAIRPVDEKATKNPAGNIGPGLVAMAELATAAVTDRTSKAAANEVVFFHEANTVRVPSGPALPQSAAEEVLCNAKLRLGTTKEGCVLNLGRRTRVVSAKQMLALNYRDGCCRTPGCGRTRFLHAHHVKFWGRGGNTDLDNLIMLCGTCHRALHDGQFTITALGEQKFEFLYANGDVIDPAPPTEGFADGLLRGDIPDDAIIPRWDGEPLHLDHAVSVILDGWAA
ncbi:DUF222 domain-containing protein [Rhodococcus qingshengii]|uniref:HNH endonuclease signature motif containing protein n=1 Tax=Rhodococcus qingshengii TaxID=334542 RepID=UPI0009F53229|nr:HNH endonuclease signature motif containing protein [Rhodococcus qingshengii]MCQ4146266.1 HNH endonuclease [Rhodococcus qingshengii]ORC17223.1 HNH endonuclease [Rhodococcus qingshengii]